MSCVPNSPVDPFDNLFIAVEDLLRRIADTDDLELRRKRAKLRAEMISLQNNFPHISSQLAPPPVLPAPAAVEEELSPVNWGQPAIAALTGVALALTVFQAS